MIAGDQPAAWTVSYAGYDAFESITSGRPFVTASPYGRRPAESALREALIETTNESVLRVARPIPGKCLSVGRTPRAARPWAKEYASHAVRDGFRDHVRPSLSMNDDEATGTSATGARSTSMPRSRSAAPVAAPCDRATDVDARAPICGGDRVGGAHGIRFTEPPSWSTAISSGGRPPAVAAAWSCPVSVRNPDALVMFAPNRITPPTSPRLIRPSRSALGVVPSIRTTSF